MTRRDQSEGDRARDEVLAGEYVLGVLSIEDRARVEARIRTDRPFAAIVARWEQNLSPLDDEYQPVAAPAYILPAVEKRLFGPSRARSGRLSGLWGSVALWRGLAFGSIFLLGGMLIYGQRPEPQGSRPMPVLAQMEGQNDAALSLVARYDAGAGRLLLTPVANAPAQQHSIEVWMIRGSDPEISLGILPQSGEGEVIVPEKLRTSLGEGVTLAVSLEPFGGSPTGRATGPILAAGQTRIP